MSIKYIQCLQINLTFLFSLFLNIIILFICKTIYKKKIFCYKLKMVKIIYEYK